MVPNERVEITGFAGLLFTSTDGREHQVDAERGQRGGGVPGRGPGQVQVVELAERPR